jgi:hypothetical protein
MLNRFVASCLILACLSRAGHVSGNQNDAAATASESKAVEFLTREVPAWSKNNGCFSCHNNGDAARALYLASQKGYRIPTETLSDTTGWLIHPSRWIHNKGAPGPSDQRLANLQFALALLTAVETGYVADRKPLRAASQKVAADQDSSGAWLIDSGTAVGSPATYGSVLATAMACRVLRAAGLAEHRQSVERAQQWLLRVPVNSIDVAAAWLLSAGNIPGRSATNRSQECLTLIGQAQTREGGWGPYPDSPPEVFDTAIVLLALAGTEKHGPSTGQIQRGRSFLAAQQNPDGSWPATTRPPGGESYAQTLSTTGWATIALLATR